MDTPDTILGRRPTLLIVDDQPINIETMFEIFGEENEVVVATCGQRALDICQTSPPDLILLDIVMPEISGLEVCQRLKSEASTRDIPIIFVTALGKPEDESLALQAGAVDFITKPVNPAVVRARVRTHLLLKAQSDYLRSLALVDPLTGIGNRRSFDERLDGDWRDCQRHGRQMSLIMTDIDFFKRFNDSYGHQQGDWCLRKVAHAMSTQLKRPRDLIARYGGEEFACILPECDAQGAALIAEQFLRAVLDLAIPHSASAVLDRVSISAGIASLTPSTDTSATNLIKAADEQLYRAKSEGRNRYCMARLDMDASIATD